MMYAKHGCEYPNRAKIVDQPCCSRGDEAALTDGELDVEPEQNPGDVHLIPSCRIDGLVHSAEDAAPDDGHGDGEADQAKDGCENELLAQGDLDLPEDRNGKAEDYRMAQLISMCPRTFMDNERASSRENVLATSERMSRTAVMMT